MSPTKFNNRRLHLLIAALSYGPRVVQRWANHLFAWGGIDVHFH